MVSSLTTIRVGLVRDRVQTLADRLGLSFSVGRTEFDNWVVRAWADDCQLAFQIGEKGGVKFASVQTPLSSVRIYKTTKADMCRVYDFFYNVERDRRLLGQKEKS
jgi:hypothetical protein